MVFFSQLLLLEVPHVSASILPTDKRTETRQPPLERVSFFLSCHVNSSISSFAAIRRVFQYWVTNLKYEIYYYNVTEKLFPRIKYILYRSDCMHTVSLYH